MRAPPSTVSTAFAPGLLVDADGGRGLAVHAARHRVVALGELDAADVAHAHDRRAFLAGAHDDVLELLRLGEQALRGDDELLLDAGRRRLRAELADAEGLVLALDRGSDLLHRDAELGHAVGPQPHAHRDVGRAEHRRAVRARHALQLLEHVQVGVVVDIGGVVALVGRVDRHHHHDAGGLLVDHQALLRHHLRQLRHRLAQLVLHVDLVDVRVAARLEHHHDLRVAARGAGRVVVEQVVDAVQLRLDRRRDVVGDHLGGRARVARVDRDLRRRHVRVLLDRRDRHRHRARRARSGSR